MQQESPIHLYFNLAWRRKWYLLAPAALGLIVSAAVLKKLPNIYEATAKVTEEREGVQLDGGRRSNSEAARMALVRLQLPDFAKPVACKVYGLPVDAELSDQKISMVKNALTLELYGDLIYFKARGVDPEFVTKVANFYAEEFVKTTYDKKTSKAGKFANFYDKELVDKKATLDAKEREISRFKELHRGALPDDIDAHNQAIERLRADSVQARSDLQARQDERNTFVSSLSALGTTEPDGTVGAAPNDPLARVRLLEKELAGLRMRFTEKHPDVQGKIREIALLKEQIALEPPPKPQSEHESERPTAANPLDPSRIGTINYNQLVSLDREIRRNQGRVSNYETEINKHQGAIEAANRVTVEWSNLSRERANLAEEYNTLYSSSQKASLAQDMTTNLQADSFHLQQPAQIPDEPVSPVPLKVLSLGVGLGLALGVGFVALLEMVDQTYKSSEELARDLDVPVVATITRINEARGMGKDDHYRRKAV